MKTLLRLILDRSGSMEGKQADVIGGVNRFIDDQKKVREEALLAMSRFDNEYENFRSAMPLAEVRPLTAEDYVPRGATALLDAIGRSLSEMDAEWIKHYPERAIVVIVTDGYENASREFTLARVKEMIGARERSGKWAFVYLGAGLQAFEQSAGLGISAINTAGYVPTTVGTRTAYAAASASVATMRATGSNVANLGGMLPEDQDAEDEADKNFVQSISGNITVTGNADTVTAWTPPPVSP